MAIATESPHESIPLRLRLWLEGGSLLRILLILIWVTTWYQVFLAHRVAWLSTFGVFFLILAASFYLTRLFNRFHWRSTPARVFFIFWLLASVGLSLYFMVIVPSLGADLIPALETGLTRQPDFGILIHLVITAGLIWRGITMAQGSMDLGDTLRSFQVGVAMFLLFGLIFGRQPGAAFLPVYAFLLISLLALATTRITDLAFMRGGRLPGSFRTWWLPILAAAVACVTLALLSGWLLSTQLSTVSVALIAVLFILLFLVSIVVALPVLLIIYLVLPWLQGKFAEGIELLPIQIAEDVSTQIFGDDLEEIVNETLLVDRSYPILLAVVALLIVVVIFFTVQARLRARIVTAVDDSAGSRPPSPFFNPSAQDDTAGRRWFDPRRYLAAARIRRIYASLLSLAERLGTPRAPALTPLEFLPRLNETFPGRESELSSITTAYLSVRYGEVPETEAEVQQILAAWNQIERESRPRRRQLKSNR